MVRMSISLALAVVVCICGRAANAADQITREEIDRLAKPLVDGEWCPGFVIGLIDESGSRAFGYGRTSETNDEPPGCDTVFEIGSVTKTFTGVLLAEMAGRGEVSLDDPVQKYLPEAVKVPQVGERPITLVDLATHRSGLPRLPDNMNPADPGNPYADYTVEQMYAFVNGCKPKRGPGVAYEYSNFAMGLLGHVLARRADKDYETLVTERILRPLKMNDTRIALDDAARKRLAQGHDADGEPVSNWDLPTLAGAGALRSTMNDMLEWAAATIDPPDTPLGKAIELARTPRAPADDEAEIGLGWHAFKKGSLLSHGGQTGGYHAFCALKPSKRIAVVVLASNGSPHIDALGALLGRRLDGEAVEPLELRKPTKLTAEQLDAVVGRYLMVPLNTMTVTRDGDRLYAQLGGQPRVRIYPESPTEFFYKAVEARLTFRMNQKTGRAYMMTLRQSGLTLPALRAEGTPTTQPGEDEPD